MKKVLILTIVLVALLSLAPVTSAGGCCGCCVAPRSPGYWKNHPEAWPVEEFDLGGVHYTKAEAIEWMNTPVKGDKTITMFAAVVAAALNVHNEACRCEELWTPLWEGEQWMADWGPVGSGVRASSEAWQYSHGEAIYWALDAYNNGYLCN